jgi:cyclophilin family peptidyl-prolyl cis-trans isomerase/HEAT repeat protein
MARSEGGPSTEAAARLRRLAMAALVAGKAAGSTTISTAFGDADDQVRGLAARAATVAEPVETRFLDRAIRDQSAMVRTAVLRGLAARQHPSACGYASLALRDVDPHVAMTAIDLAGRTCAGNAAATAAIASLAAQPPPLPLQDVDPARAPQTGVSRAVPYGLDFRGARRASWQPSAHALVSLARLAPEQAIERLPKFVADVRWHVRMYAARAAGIAKAEAVLRSLAADEHANVVDAALAGLREVVGNAADDLYLQALGQSDYQLLITAAQGLKGTVRRDEAATALLDALDRISSDRRDTSRDTRKAFLDRLDEVGSAALVPRLQAYLRDFDPAIATAAAALLAKWGTPAHAAPQPLPRLALPSASELEAMAASRLSVSVRDVGRFELRLLPGEAPVNAWRFYRHARARYFDGLTIHRVVPDFILQGGSPGANEYMGDGPYTRDEVGLLSNQRGTIGLSTRGRDTGDGQFFINLVDNTLLDHTYTVFAQIERGIEVIDAILEGDVIAGVDVSGKDR